jgi:hypothetical protein
MNLGVVVCMIVRMVNVVPRLPVSFITPKAYRKPTPVTPRREPNTTWPAPLRHGSFFTWWQIM